MRRWKVRETLSDLWDLAKIGLFIGFFWAVATIPIGLVMWLVFGRGR